MTDRVHRGRTAPRYVAVRAVPDGHVRDLLHDRAARELAAHAAAAAVEDLHARRELLLLRLLELALHRPARALDASATSCSPRRSTHRRRGHAAAALLTGAVVDQPRPARVLQVLRLLRQLASNVLGDVGIDVSSAILIGSRSRSGSRSSRSRRSATSSTSTGGDFEPVKLLDFAVYLSFFPHLVAGPIVRAARVPAAAQGAPRPAPHRREPRVLPHLRRAVQEGGDRELPRDPDRRHRVRVAEPARARSSSSSASTGTRSRSTPTSAATPTWRSGSRCCSASGSRRTSTARTPRRRCRTSGAAGT